MSIARLSLLVTLAVTATAGTVHAYKCHALKPGTKLYADVTASTVIGETTTDAIGWFAWSGTGDPTMRLRFVKLDGDTLLVELDADVKDADAAPVPCPGPTWTRDPDAMLELTWPDGRNAGNASKRSIAATRKRAPKRHGRACFAVDVPGVAATVCAPVTDRVKTTCVAVASGKPVFARPTTAAQLGVTTKKLVGELHLRVDDFVIVDFSGPAHGFERAYVKRADTKAARCPAPEEDDHVGVLGVIAQNVALLPDGTDAGFRVTPSFFGFDPDDKPDQVEVDGRRLRCFAHEPLDGLRYRVCVE